MNAGYPTLDLDMQLCFPLYATTRAVTRKYTELLAEVGLTYPQHRGSGPRPTWMPCAHSCTS